MSRELDATTNAGNRRIGLQVAHSEYPVGGKGDTVSRINASVTALIHVPIGEVKILEIAVCLGG